MAYKAVMHEKNGSGRERERERERERKRSFSMQRPGVRDETWFVTKPGHMLIG